MLDGGVEAVGTDRRCESDLVEVGGEAGAEPGEDEFDAVAVQGVVQLAECFEAGAVNPLRRGLLPFMRIPSSPSKAIVTLTTAGPNSGGHVKPEYRKEPVVLRPDKGSGASQREKLFAVFIKQRAVRGLQIQHSISGDARPLHAQVVHKESIC